MSSELERAIADVDHWDELLKKATPGSTEFAEYAIQLKKARAYRQSLSAAFIVNPYSIRFLEKFGLNTPVEQAFCVLSVIGSGSFALKYALRAHGFQQYVYEKNESRKIMIAGKYRFSESELRAAKEYLLDYRGRAKWYSVLPISFVVIEVGKELYLKGKNSFANWKK